MCSSLWSDHEPLCLAFISKRICSLYLKTMSAFPFHAKKCLSVMLQVHPQQNRPGMNPGSSPSARLYPTPLILREPSLPLPVPTAELSSRTARDPSPPLPQSRPISVAFPTPPILRTRQKPRWGWEGWAKTGKGGFNFVK